MGGARPRAVGSPARSLPGSAWSRLASLHGSRGHHLAVQRQGFKGLAGQLPPHHPPQQRLQAVSQISGYPLWALPSSMWLTPLRRLLCLTAGLATMCYATWRRWSTCNKQVSPAAWSFWFSAKHMTASAAHGCWSACPAWALDSGLADGSA